MAVAGSDRSAQALRASERRNRALLDAIPDNMFRIRGDGTYVDFHTNAPDALTLPPDRIVGLMLFEEVDDTEVEVFADRCCWGLFWVGRRGHPFLRRHVHYWTRQPGGYGAVRETIELILDAQGKLRDVFKSYLR